MPQRTAKVEQEYAGRKVDVGERFDVEENHIKLLLHLGRIEPVEGESGYVGREMEADKKPTYRTRDVKRRGA